MLDFWKGAAMRGVAVFKKKAAVGISVYEDTNASRIEM